MNPGLSLLLWNSNTVLYCTVCTVLNILYRTGSPQYSTVPGTHSCKNVLLRGWATVRCQPRVSGTKTCRQDIFQGLTLTQLIFDFWKWSICQLCTTIWFCVLDYTILCTTLTSWYFDCNRYETRLQYMNEISIVDLADGQMGSLCTHLLGTFSKFFCKTSTEMCRTYVMYLHCRPSLLALLCFLGIFTHHPALPS